MSLPPLSALYLPSFYQSPELVARLEKLQARQDQLRYRAMVKNVDKEVSFPRNYHDLKYTLAPINYLCSLVENSENVPHCGKCHHSYTSIHMIF